MAKYVYDGTQNSLDYQLIDDGQIPVAPTLGAFWGTPREYQPIALEYDEDADDIFIEPRISATYFAMVDLEIGGKWVITDYRNRALYLGVVDLKTPDELAGTVTYRFTTKMTYLASAEPAGILITAEDADLGPDATPNEVLVYLMSKWGPETGLTLAPDPPELHLRGASGPVIPFVYALTLDQEPQNSKSFIGWLDELFSTFEGYAYRLDGNRLKVLPPYWQQTESLSLDDAAVVGRTRSKSSSSIVNSQTVRSQPTVRVGTFSYDDDGEPEIPNDLPEVATPVFYRQGFFRRTPPPADRLFRKSGEATKLLYKPDRIPVVPPVRVTWTAYVFITNEYNDGSKRTFDRSDGIVEATHVIDMQPGQSIDLPTAWKDGGLSFAGADWAWSIDYSADGESVSATLIVPVGNAVQELIIQPGDFLEGIVKRSAGAEFHLSVQSMAYERSQVVYSSTYGVYTPPTLPEGVDPPPMETAGEDDAEVLASKAIYGKKAGTIKDLNLWTLVPSGTAAGSVAEAITGKNRETIRATILKTLLDVAQHAVKEHILPYTDLRLTLARPFVVTAADLFKLVQYGPDTGQLRSYRYQERYSIGASDVTLELGIRVRETSERQPITIVPYEPPPSNPIPGPETPTFEGPTPPAPPTAGPGMVQLDWPNRFDLLSIDGPNGTRVRLYRTDAARSGDAPRPWGEKPVEQIMPLLILDQRIEDGNHLDLHAVLGHVPEGVVYGNIEGGTVTFHRFLPSGYHG